MDLKEFLHRNFSKYSDVYSQTIAAGSPQSLAAIEATGSNGNFKWISAKTLAENRSNRSPEEEKALQTLLKPNNVTAGTPSRRRRVESMPGSPASVNSSSINFKIVILRPDLSDLGRFLCFISGEFRLRSRAPSFLNACLLSFRIATRLWSPVLPNSLLNLHRFSPFITHRKFSAFCFDTTSHVSTSQTYVASTRVSCRCIALPAQDRTQQPPHRRTS